MLVANFEQLKCVKDRGRFLILSYMYIVVKPVSLKMDDPFVRPPGLRRGP